MIDDAMLCRENAAEFYRASAVEHLLGVTVEQEGWAERSVKEYSSSLVRNLYAKSC